MTTLDTYSLYGPKAASHRIRLAQFAPAARQAGFRLRLQSLLDNRYVRRRFMGKWPNLLRVFRLYLQRMHRLLRSKPKARVVGAIVYAELFPGMPFWLERLFLPAKYIYDLDDSFFLKYRTGKLSLLRPFLSNKIDRLMQAAAAVTAGNSFLCDYAAIANSRVFLLPSAVDPDTYRPVDRPANAEFTVGWVGSPSTEVFLGELVEPLRRLAAEKPFRLLVMGGAFPHRIPGAKVETRTWSRRTEVGLIHSLDAGLMPLPDNEWSWGKCGFKLITYMACGIPVVASEVGANKEIVDEESGFLVYTPEEWVEALRRLRDDSGLRRRMGEAGRRKVCAEYSLQAAAPVFVRTLKEVFGDGPLANGRRRTDD